MIDAREYSTTSELTKAMNFEYNCSILPVIRNDIFKTELMIEQLAANLDRLRKDEARIKQEIDDYHKSNKDKTLIIERQI